MKSKRAERGISRRDVLASAIGGSLMMAYPHARAQDTALNFPSKPMKLVLPYPAGNTPDAVARWTADELTKVLGQSVVVDNRGGAGGRLGTESVVRAPADGLTMLLADAGPTVIAPFLYDVRYEALRDLIPVTVLVTSDFFVAVPTSLGVSSVAELVALVKSQPGKLNYGTAGLGSIHHLMVEAFKAVAGLDMVHVPFKGGTEAVISVVQGAVAMMITGALNIQSFVKSGQLKMLATLSPQRTHQFPDVPTLAELGFPGMVFQGDLGIFVPAGTPPAIVAKLSTEFNKVIRQPDMVKRLQGVGVDSIGTTPAKAVTHWETERDKFAKAVKAAGLRKGSA